MRFHPYKVRAWVSMFGTSAGFWVMFGFTVAAGASIAILLIHWFHTIFQ